MAEALDKASSPLAGMVVGDEAARKSARRWALVGLATLAMTFGVAVAWSSLAPLSSAVVAQGIVKVESSRKKVQHPEGGVVKAILVREGDAVNAGDVLVRIDDTRAGAAHGLVVGGRDMAIAALARLQAEREGRASISFPASLMQRSAESQVADAMRAQQSLFNARRSTRAGEVDILEQQIGALQGEIEGFESQRRAKIEQIESLTLDQKGLTELDAVGMVEKTRLRALERDLARVKGERDELASRIASTLTAISEKRFRKLQVQKNFQEEVAAEWRKAQAEAFDLRERESTTRRTLEQTEIRAPASGTVTELKIHTTGGVVQPGEVLMEIVPIADRLSIEGRVLPQDIDRVQLGQAAGVKLHAFNSRTTPELNGQLLYVAADATTDLRTDQGFFLVKVGIDELELARLNGDKLLPGMQADVFIRTGEQTFISFLLQPLSESIKKAWRER